MPFSQSRTTVGEDPMRRALKSTLIGGALAILVSGGMAFATGGAGGMGGGGARPADLDKDLPGGSGPRYDPAVEYTKAVAAAPKPCSILVHSMLLFGAKAGDAA